MQCILCSLQPKPRVYIDKRWVQGEKKELLQLSAVSPMQLVAGEFLSLEK
jgi:hypothetical protein